MYLKVFLLLLLPLLLSANETVTMKLRISGPNLNLRFQNAVGELVPTGQVFSQGVVEIEVPRELVPENPEQVDFKAFINDWKKKRPQDFKKQSGYFFQPIKIVTNANGIPEQQNLFMSLDFQANKTTTRMNLLSQDAKINMDSSCAWIEEQIPNHVDVHQRGVSEGSIECELCETIARSASPPVGSFFTTINEIKNYFELPRECVAMSMQDGLGVVQSRFQRCDNKDTNRKAIRPTCVTNELIQYNQQIVTTTALCFGLSPRLLFPMINHESRFFSNIQASGGDTGFTQLTGPFVFEMARVYGDDLGKLNALAGTTNPACAQIKQEYESNLPLLTRDKNQRCSWMNPVTNLVLASAHFRDVMYQQRPILDELSKGQLDDHAKNQILSYVASHAHHLPLSKTSLRRFLNSPSFKSLLLRYKGKLIPAEVFLERYKESLSGKARQYINQVVKDYERLSEKRPNCGW